MPETQQSQGPSKDDSKQLKRLLESHLAVLEHKLGRPPSMQEMTDFLKGAEQSDGDVERGEEAEVVAGGGEPKVLTYKVYTGMKSEGANRTPDAHKVLFFETGDGRCYDTARHEWCAERPSIVDHLPSRPMMFDEQGHDIMSALVHGVLDDEDYSALDKAQMLNDHHKSVWQLNKQLQAQVSQLEKSEDPEEDEGGEDSPEVLDDAGDDLSGLTDAAEGEISPEVDELPGENVLEQIIRGAMEQALNAQEAKIELMVKAAFDRHMSAFMHLLEQEAEPTQEFGTADESDFS